VKKHAHLYNRQARKEKKKKKRVEEALRKSEKNKTKVKLLSFGRNDPEREMGNKHSTLLWSWQRRKRSKIAQSLRNGSSR
jgi:hypothetical protein